MTAHATLRCLRQLGALLFLSGFLSAGLVAEPSDTSVAPVGAYDHADAWSMQFKVVNNLNLGSFQGALISAQRHLSRSRALRFGITLSGASSDRTDDVVQLYEDPFRRDSSHRHDDIDQDNQQISVAVQYIFIGRPLERLHLFAGTGPSLGITREVSEITERYETATQPLQTRALVSNYRRTWSVGIVGVWGVEWCVWDNISLICEYGAGIEYAATFQENTRTESLGGEYTVTTHKDSHTLGFRSASVNFGVSAYF